MSESSVAEALLIRDGIVAAIGDRDEVLALAAGEVPIVDIGESVAYPGFIDAHAHWIGDRGYYGLDSQADAMTRLSPAAGRPSASRGSTTGASTSSNRWPPIVRCRYASTPIWP